MKGAASLAKREQTGKEKEGRIRTAIRVSVQDMTFLFFVAAPTSRAVS